MVPQPHSITSPSSHTEVDKNYFGQTSVCFGTIGIYGMVSHTAQVMYEQVPDRDISLWEGRKTKRVCSLKDWTAVGFCNPLRSINKIHNFHALPGILQRI